MEGVAEAFVVRDHAAGALDLVVGFLDQVHVVLKLNHLCSCLLFTLVLALYLDHFYAIEVSDVRLKILLQLQLVPLLL